MKLLSLNVGLFEQNNEALTAFFRSHNADILCLQEVTKEVSPYANEAYISIRPIDIASQALTYSFFAPIWALADFKKPDFHGQADFNFELGGVTEFGQYFKSKYPITKGQNVFVQNHFTYITDWSNWPQEDYRAVQVIDLQLPKTQLRLLNYHGIWSKDKRGSVATLRACQRINQLANEVRYPSIVCGDFNLYPDTDSMQVFTNHKNLLDEYHINTTRPDSNELNNQPRNVVDYILVSAGIIVNDFTVLKTEVSDHLPLLMDFDI